jgi:hypothetical protein
MRPQGEARASAIGRGAVGRLTRVVQLTHAAAPHFSLDSFTKGVLPYRNGNVEKVPECRFSVFAGRIDLW